MQVIHTAYLVNVCCTNCGTWRLFQQIMPINKPDLHGLTMREAGLTIGHGLKDFFEQRHQCDSCHRTDGYRADRSDLMRLINETRAREEEVEIVYI